MRDGLVCWGRTRTLRAHWLGSSPKRRSWDIILTGLTRYQSTALVLGGAHLCSLPAVASSEKTARRSCRATANIQVLLLYQKSSLCKVSSGHQVMQTLEHMIFIRPLETWKIISSKNCPSPAPSNQSGSPPVHSRVEDCAFLVGAILCREKFGSPFTFYIMPLRPLQYEKPVVVRSQS